MLKLSITKMFDKDEVSMGRTITIQELPDEEPEEYQIVGESESDPFNGKISNESPMAKGLLWSQSRRSS